MSHLEIIKTLLVLAIMSGSRLITKNIINTQGKLKFSEIAIVAIPLQVAVHRSQWGSQSNQPIYHQSPFVLSCIPDKMTCYICIIGISKSTKQVWVVNSISKILLRTTCKHTISGRSWIQLVSQTSNFSETRNLYFLPFSSLQYLWFSKNRAKNTRSTYETL